MIYILYIKHYHYIYIPSAVQEPSRRHIWPSLHDPLLIPSPGDPKTLQIGLQFPSEWHRKFSSQVPRFVPSPIQPSDVQPELRFIRLHFPSEWQKRYSLQDPLFVPSPFWPLIVQTGKILVYQLMFRKKYVWFLHIAFCIFLLFVIYTYFWGVDYWRIGCFCGCWKCSRYHLNWITGFVSILLPW